MTEAEASIGRVVTDPSVRHRGLGHALMTEAITRCQQLAPGRNIRIHAQSYLERFYQRFGFQTVSPPYLVDGIVHLDMVLFA